MKSGVNLGSPTYSKTTHSSSPFINRIYHSNKKCCGNWVHFPDKSDIPNLNDYVKT
jgi:hypothetical protein